MISCVSTAWSAGRVTKRELKNRIAELEQELAHYKRAWVNPPKACAQHSPKSTKRDQVDYSGLEIEDDLTLKVQRGIV